MGLTGGIMENMTALDTSTLESIGMVQPTNEPTVTSATEGQSAQTDPIVTEVTEPAQEPNVNAEGISTEPNVTTTSKIEELEIEGIGKVKIDDIKEWQKGNLRQSDYTRKTQELAKQREELAEAVEVFNYLKENPQIVQALQAIDEQGVVNQGVMQKTTPENAMMKQLYYNQKSMEVDMQLDKLREKYGEFDAVAVLNTATQLRTEDLEQAYKLVNFDKIATDQQKIKEQVKAELKAELEQNRFATQTIVSAPSSQMQPNLNTLSPEEVRVATGMGLSAADYAKWKNK